MKVKVNGIDMNYELTGASGSAVVLIHGSGDNLEAWWPQVPALAEKYRVLRYDVRGHGKTETPEGDIDPDVWVEDLYQLLRVVGIQKAYVIGYSMGAGTAVAFAAAHHDMVEAIVMANGGVPGLVELSENQQKEMAERRASQVAALNSQGMAGIVDDRISGVFSPGFADKNPETVEKYKALFLENDGPSYAKVLEASPNRTTPDMRRVTGKNAIPTMIIAGEHDQYSGPEGAKKQMETLQGAELRILPTGHASNLEMPGEFNRIVLDFLEDVEFLSDSVTMQGAW